MAIQKIPVHGANIADTILGLLVPTFFDSYEESETAGTYNLYKGSTVAATVTSYGTVTLKYNGGSSTIETVPAEYTLDYIYSCANGLAFQYHYAYEASAICSFLTKDNSGAPTVAKLDPNSSDRARAASCNSTSLSQSLQRSTNDPLSEITSLAPIILNDDHGSYCPNIFIMVYRQRNDPAEIIDIDGVKYISNGGIVLKDV